MTILGLLVALGLVWGCAGALRRFFAESCPLVLAAAAPALALALLTVGANLLSPWLLPGGAGAVVCVAGLVAWRWAGPPLARPSTPWALLVALGTLVVGVFTWNAQWGRVDYDFWLDFAQQGLMQRGEIPPGHPFFPDLTMEGHYGRNLLVAAVAQLLDLDLAAAGILLTTACQMLTFMLLSTSLARQTRSAAVGFFGSTLAFLGLAVGGWAGLLDHYFHHASLAWLLLVLATYLALRSVELDFPWGALAITAVVMAALALTFEIYFGLLGLALLPVAFRARRLPLFLAASLVLSVLQGGVLGDLAKRAVSDPPEPASTTLLNQTQRVVLDVPKAELFKIRLEPWHYWRVSRARSTPTLFRHLPNQASGRFYAPIWSAEVLRLHWLPLYLSPLAAVFLLRRRQTAGLLWLAFGAFAYLIPGLVDFGPIYESEYYRWELAAGLGFGLALGVAMGLWWDESPTEARGLVLGLVLVASSVAGLHRLGTTLSRSVVARYPSAQAYLLHHRGHLGIEPVDLEASEWLRQHASRGERMMVNYSLGHPFGLTSESTLVGLTGIRSVGHAFPTASDFVGTPPFRPSALARVFWKAPRTATLAALDVDWLYVRVTEGPDPLEGFEGLTLAFEARDEEGHRRRLYRVTAAPARLPEASTPRAASLLDEAALKNLEKGQVVEVKLLDSAPQQGLVHYRFRPLEPERFDVEPDPVTFPLEKSLPLAVPVEPGGYELQLSLELPSDPEGLQKLPPVPCEVASSWGTPVEPPAEVTGLPLEVVTLELEGTLRPDMVVEARVRLRNRSSRRIENDALEVSLVPYDLRRAQVVRDASLYRSRQPIAVEGGGDVVLTLPLVTPARAGLYRFDVQLWPAAAGTGTRLEGVEKIVVGPSWQQVSGPGRG